MKCPVCTSEEFKPFALKRGDDGHCCCAACNGTRKVPFFEWVYHKLVFIMGFSDFANKQIDNKEYKKKVKEDIDELEQMMNS